MKKIIFPLLFILLVAPLALLLGREETNAGSAGVDQTAGTGEVMIGGAFTLTDQQGKAVRDSDFRGRMMLVFFGFTHCPDICPVTTKILSDTMGMLGDKASQVAPIFISIDPERDTPAVLKDFFSNFDARMVGLTGNADQIKQVAAAYKAYYAKSQPEDEEADAADRDDYLMDHSGYIYMMDRDGKYVKHFQYDAKPEDITQALKPYLK